MTKTVTAAEAKAHLGDYLRSTERGDAVVITRHGKAVAALVPPDELIQLRRLQRAGTQKGLAGIAGGWKGSDALVRRIVDTPRSKARATPRLR